MVDIEQDTAQALGADLTVLKKNGDQVNLNITLDEFVDFDIEVATPHERLSNQEILADINNDQVEVSDNKDDESVVDEPVTKPEIEEARKIIQILENFSLFSKLGEAMMKSLKRNELYCDIKNIENI